MGAYWLAQRAIADLKAAVRQSLEEANGEGRSNAQIGRLLGIYMGHKGHEGHVSRTILALLEAEGSVTQDPHTKLWRLVDHINDHGY